MTDDGLSLGEKLRLARDRAGDARDVAAKKLGVSRNTLARYEGDETQPDAEFLKRFGELYEIDLGGLLSEQGRTYRPPPTIGADMIPSEARGFVSLPLWNAEASAGTGRAMPSRQEAAQMTIARDWLVSWGLSSNAFLIVAKGDSMEPTISDGDLLLADRNVEPMADAVYIVQRDGDLQVKRLQRRAAGQVAIISDNKLYPEEVVSAVDAPAIYVQGRVRLVFKTI